MSLFDFPWLFEFGAPIYNWFNSQGVWLESCARLAAYFPRAVNARIRVLDLGCGPGNSAIEMARVRPDAFIVGLDLAPKMLEIAQNETRRAKLTENISYVLADATALPFSENTFDVTTGHSFLYLVGDRAGVLREAYRVLRRGGRWVSMEPRDGKTSNWISKHWTNVRFMVSVLLWRPYSKMHGRLDEQKFPETLARAGFKKNGTEVAIEGLGIIGYGEK
ncbi:MAG: class I SAM-dependent methyltransferase [Chloroflexota bacterium]|nr:MAG: class I SAM-dependent methyltransferase [Chloroflexota bacterium]